MNQRIPIRAKGGDAHEAKGGLTGKACCQLVSSEKKAGQIPCGGFGPHVSLTGQLEMRGAKSEADAREHYKKIKEVSKCVK